MSDRFKLSGSYTTTPLSGEPSFDAAIAASIDETVTISAKMLTELTLSSDSPVSVDFGAVTNANIVILKSTSGVKVKALVTSADGTDQAVPFDTYWILVSLDVPITAISLTRETGVATTVRVFLGEESS